MLEISYVVQPTQSILGGIISIWTQLNMFDHAQMVKNKSYWYGKGTELLDWFKIKDSVFCENGGYFVILT